MMPSKMQAIPGSCAESPAATPMAAYQGNENAVAN
jgi:hypothetical protein